MSFVGDPLLVDLFEGDGRTTEDVKKLRDAGPPWHGIWFKATEGVQYRASSWLDDCYRTANDTDKADWWTTTYHYYLAHQNPVAQAYYYLWRTRKLWTERTIHPVVDVERGDQLAGVTAEQVINGVSTFVEIVRRETGRGVLLYGGEWLRSLGIKSTMGCNGIIVAAYTPALDPKSYVSIGFSYGTGDRQLFGWQYCGDGEAYLKNYPRTTPLGPEDITAVTMNGGGAKALQYLSRKWPVL